MSAVTYFPDFNTDPDAGNISGSSFAKPDGTVHRVEVFTDLGQLLVRVELEGSEKPVDLLFSDEQAVLFRDGVNTIVEYQGIEERVVKSE